MFREGTGFPQRLAAARQAGAGHRRRGWRRPVSSEPRLRAHAAVPPAPAATEVALPELAASAQPVWGAARSVKAVASELAAPGVAAGRAVGFARGQAAAGLLAARAPEPWAVQAVLAPQLPAEAQSARPRPETPPAFVVRLSVPTEFRRRFRPESLARTSALVRSPDDRTSPAPPPATRAGRWRRPEWQPAKPHSAAQPMDPATADQVGAAPPRRCRQLRQRSTGPVRRRGPPTANDSTFKRGDGPRNAGPPHRDSPPVSCNRSGRDGNNIGPRHAHRNCRTQ